MSQGPRILRHRADAAATLLFSQWRMHQSECMVAGSIRRGQPEVGDIDLVAPLPTAGSRDELYMAIDATVKRTGTLFGSERVTFTTAVSGLKPHFKLASLQVDLTGLVVGREKETVSLPVQIHRYAPDNRGWVELMKTGPRDFNVWFLAKWIERFQIRSGISEGNPDGNALIDNFLVDPWGKVIPVSSELECFQKLGIDMVHPHDRAAHPDAARGLARTERDRVMR